MLRQRIADLTGQARGLPRRPGARLPAWHLPALGLAGMPLARRYLLVSLVFVVIGGGVVAIALGQLIESSAINRTTSVTALYADSFLAPEVQSLAASPDLSQSEIAALQSLLSDSPLAQKVVSFRIWSTDGRILYSPVPELIGRQFDMSGDRGEAAQGAVIGDISDLSDPENAYERERWDRLIEIYLPVRAIGSSRIIAVAEFYQLPDELEDEVNRDRLITWGLVAGATFLAYLALVRVVRQGSETILLQEGELRRQVAELSTLLDQNARLSDRIRHAAARTTALTELERRRIGSDLHDGPSQTLALAMLRLDVVEGRLDAAGLTGEADLQEVRGAMESALTDMRGIAAGLRTPELNGPARVTSCSARSPNTSAWRRRPSWCGSTASRPARRSRPRSPSTGSCPRRCRTRRATDREPPSRCRVSEGVDGDLIVEVSDRGPGFDPARKPAEGHLGLAGMRERAELLGGRFELESAPGVGTLVRATLPLVGPTGEEEA